MSKDAIIRLAEADDAEAIHAMLEALAGYIGAETKMVASAADLRRFGFGEHPAFEALIAESDGEALGLCLWFPTFSTWRGRPGVYVQDLYVSDHARGMGLGRRLLAAAAERGRQIGATHLRLAVDHDNSDAKAAYRRIGLVHIEEDHIFQISDGPFDDLAGGSESLKAAAQ
ncbi:MAG: GNAT family N-acetyltransferase [Hyphomicrobiales bacterium]|nr:MAG: GNAT family N-acetyltransferase [Hyphomicrobiales bacterium]